MGKKTVISGTVDEIINVLDKAGKSIKEKNGRQNNEADADQKPIMITSATIKEEMCNYGYEIMTGPTKGDKIPSRKGSAYIHEDMQNAFNDLCIHLAVLDDAYKYAHKDLPSFAKLWKDPDGIANGFFVTGFKVHGTEENEGYILIGEKTVSHGSISLETPKISKSSAYKYFDELEESISKCRSEVEEYMNGKAAPRFEQTALEFAESEDKSFDNPLD